MNERSPSIYPSAVTALPSGGSAPEVTLESIAVAGGARLPAFVGEALDRLYGNIHSSLAHLAVYGGIESVTHVCIVRGSRDIDGIFLYRIDGDTAQVINEGMQLEEEDVTRFAAHVFASFPQVDTISLHAVHTDITRLRLPFQRHVCTANIVLSLPPSSQEYLASLGKNTRRNIRRYMDKFVRDFPGFRFDIFERDAVQPEHVRGIMDLNRARIAGKNKIYSIDNEEERIIALAQACGLVGVATIDGRICGGAVGYLAGDNYFFKVIAHDPQYNAYSAGILCCYLMICACIERGCKEYNFMWNEYEYKFALGAVRRDLDHLTIYRSHLQRLLHARTVVRNVLDAARYRAALLMEQEGKLAQLSMRERVAFHFLDGAKRLRRLALRLKRGG